MTPLRVLLGDFWLREIRTPPIARFSGFCDRVVSLLCRTATGPT